ncbi:MAG: 1-deoxy-D-xylulose-5-phosphate synthase [Mycobacterium sp.]|nr:1-deoxy-D-xylulose-5-phosphate synthase [Mycobacterium sp.]
MRPPPPDGPPVSRLLPGIAGPEDLRELGAAQLTELAAEVRAFLVENVTRTGGHLGPNLGVVELTIALHRVFRSPHDVLLWDTGHQAYVHKLLTGRQADFTALRQPEGLSGYPSRAESPHDHVENSHASTALAYADGLAKAFEVSGRPDRSVVAVIGDGALTGGLAWEALNNLGGAPGRPVVVVLNDNGRSYDPTVGGLAAHLAVLRGREPGSAEPSLFTQLGLAYVGPVDGHDIAAVEQALEQARAWGAPVVVHCVTRKGNGYAPAEEHEDDRMHSVGARRAAPSRTPPTGASPAGSPPTWTDVLGQELAALGERRPDVVAVTAAMLRPVGLHPFAVRFPERTYDVGIAEQQAVTSAAGLAMGGLHPVVCVYATFLNRAVDQVFMDVALHGLPVTFVLDRAGVTGDDGPSHNGMWDLALLGAVPGMRVAAPRDAAELAALLTEAADDASGPTVLRFPKATVGELLPAVDRIGPGDVLRRDPDRDVLLLSVGPLAGPALAAAAELAADGIGVTVVDPRWVLPVAGDLVWLAAGYDLVVTVEDGELAGGVGDAVARALRVARVRTPVASLGLPPRFLAQGRRVDLLAAAGLDADGIAGAVRAELAAARGRVGGLRVVAGQPNARSSVR